MSTKRLHLVNPKATAKPSSERAEMIDRLGALSSILQDYRARIAPFQAEADALEAKLLEKYAESDKSPELAEIEETAGYLAKFAAREQKQEADLPARAKIFKWIGRGAYLALCRPTLEQLKSALTPQQYDATVKRERVGRRTVTVIPKAAPPAAA